MFGITTAPAAKSKASDTRRRYRLMQRRDASINKPDEAWLCATPKFASNESNFNENILLELGYLKSKIKNISLSHSKFPYCRKLQFFNSSLERELDDKSHRQWCGEILQAIKTRKVYGNFTC